LRIARIKIENFRGIKECELFFPGHTVLVGDNNTGKSTILEAIDLVLGPERLSRYPVIDEHDFYAGQYLDEEKKPIEITIEVVVVDLNDEQQRRFSCHLEWWNNEKKVLIDGPPPESTDGKNVVPALRLCFKGNYDVEEDDFSGRTFFMSPQKDDGTFEPFGVRDKRVCGFLYLRTLRTGNRALSLERGSLLDTVLRLKELRLHMWEQILNQLRKLSVADNPSLDITGVLNSVQDAVRSYVPSEWADDPHMRISNLTREHLRRIITVFMSTGAICDDGTKFSAPFQHQGTGTINTLVLALLSMIADLKQNVIFAMEEPEIAIPPHTQKRIINSIRSKSAQAIFTSHSPYVLEEFDPYQILVINRDGGRLTGVSAGYPPKIKPKKYREEFRKRFCEALLARRVLITEGRTEYDAFPAAARRLHELEPENYKTLDNLGIAIVSAESDTQVAPLGEHFRHMEKKVFAVYDKQSEDESQKIKSSVDYPFEAPEEGFENVILKSSSEDALRRYVLSLVQDGEWPPHLTPITSPDTIPLEELKSALMDYFKWSKGSGSIADFLSQCSKNEMPSYVVTTIEAITKIVESECPNKVDEINENQKNMETE